MKTYIAVAMAILLVLALGTSALAEPVSPTPVTSAPKVGKITVEGRATVKVRPDVAYVTLGVETEAKDIKGAQAQNAELMTKVINAIKAVGIESKDIQTTDYYMYEPERVKSQRSTYKVSNNIQVTLRDITLIGSLIDTAVDAGANTARNINFNVSDPTPHYAAALQDAIQNANEKGATIAGALGVSIGLPLEVVEQPQNQYYAYGNFMSDDASESGSTAIEAGEQKISATVQVIFEY